MGNPFSISFGTILQSMIDRTKTTEPVIQTLCEEKPSYQVCMICGLRGSGKTVTLTEIEKILASQFDWIICRLNPERDMIAQLASRLSSSSLVLDLLKNQGWEFLFREFPLKWRMSLLSRIRKEF